MCTSYFLTDGYHFACSSAKAMPFQQIIMHALQFQHDIDVHLLFCLTFFSWILTDGYHFTQRPVKAMPFQQIIMHALQCQHDVDVHLLFCFDLDLHLTCPNVMFNLDFIIDYHCRYDFARVTHQTLCHYTTVTKYHACIAMPTRCRFLFDLDLHITCF